MLTDEPLQTPLHRLVVHPEEVMSAVETLNYLAKVTNEEEAQEILGQDYGLTVTYQVVQLYRESLEFMISEWEAGKKITSPAPLVLDRIMPHPNVRYTNPILFLINSMDGSCGDFDPPSCQDNKRVLQGSRPQEQEAMSNLSHSQTLMELWAFS